jgi:type IV pilus assembly protein PilA
MIDNVHEAPRDTRAFTLVELLVVLMVVGILIAIAVPTFLGARTRAESRAAQATARNVLTAARVLYSDGSTYADAVTALPTIEPTYTYTAPDAPSSAVDVASVGIAGNHQELGIAVLAANGTCYLIHDVVTDAAVTYYGSTTETERCTAEQALTVISATTWSSSI